MTAATACTWLERGKQTRLAQLFHLSMMLTNHSDGNIRYFEYENDKFEFLSEYKSGDPQRGIAFLPKRGVNVSGSVRSRDALDAIVTLPRYTRMRS
jgi:hypothetical protein